MNQFGSEGVTEGLEFTDEIDGCCFGAMSCFSKASILVCLLRGVEDEETFTVPIGDTSSDWLRKSSACFTKISLLVEGLCCVDAENAVFIDLAVSLSDSRKCK